MTTALQLATELNELLLASTNNKNDDFREHARICDRLEQLALHTEREFDSTFHSHHQQGYDIRIGHDRFNQMQRVHALEVLELHLMVQYNHWRMQWIHGKWLAADVALENDDENAFVGGVGKVLHKGMHRINSVIFRSVLPLREDNSNSSGGTSAAGAREDEEWKRRQRLLRGAKNIQQAIQIMQKWKHGKRGSKDRGIGDVNVEDDNDRDDDGDILFRMHDIENVNDGDDSGERMAKRTRYTSDGDVVMSNDNDRNDDRGAPVGTDERGYSTDAAVVIDPVAIKRFLFSTKQYFTCNREGDEARNVDAFKTDPIWFRSVLHCFVMWIELFNLFAVILTKATSTADSHSNSLHKSDLSSIMTLLDSFITGRTLQQWISKYTRESFALKSSNSSPDNLEAGLGSLLPQLQHAASVSCFILALHQHKHNSNDMNQALIYCEDGQKFVPCLMLKAHILFQQGQCSEARNALIQVIDDRTLYTDSSMNMLGITYLLECDYNNAQRWFSSCFEGIAAENMGKHQLAALYNLSMQMYDNVEYAYHHKLLEKMWSVSASSPKTSKSTRIVPSVQIRSNDAVHPKIAIPDPIQVMYLLARSSLQQRQYEFAASAYRFILESVCEGKHKQICWGELHVNVLTLFKEFIYALLCNDCPAQALAVCNHVLEIFPQDLTVRMYKIDALISLERSPQECLVIIDESLALLRRMSATPQNVGMLSRHESMLLNNKAIVLVLLDKKHEAEENLAQSVRVQVNREAMFNRCLIYLDVKKDKEATTMWLSMRQIPLDREALYYMGLYQEIVTRDRTTPVMPLESHVSGKITEQQERWMDMRILKSLIERKLLQEAAAHQSSK